MWKLLAVLAAAGGLTAGGIFLTRKREAAPVSLSELQARAKRPDLTEREMLQLAEALRQRGELLKAAELAFRVRKANPALPEPHELLANLYLAGGDTAKARESLRQAAAVAPQRVETQLQWAELELGQKNLDAALEHAQAAINLDHNNARAWLAAGRVQRLARSDSSAQASFRRAIGSDPRLAPAYMELGTLHLDFDQYAEAVQPLEKAYELGDRSAATLSCLALAHVAGPGLEPDVKRAEQLLAEAGQPEMPPSWFAGGLLRQRQRDFKGAEEQFRKVLRVNPRNERAQYALATCLREAGKREDAAAAMERHHQLVTQRQRLKQLTDQVKNGRPTPLLLRDYGRALLDSDQPQEALKQLTVAAGLRPQDSQAKQWLAEARRRSAGGSGR